MTAVTRPSEAQIRSDLKTIAPYTRTIRLYSSTGGVEMVPAIADEFGLKVTLGVWLDRNTQRNEREIRSAIDLARKNRNVNGIVVGNETLYRGDVEVEDLIRIIKQVKREVGGVGAGDYRRNLQRLCEKPDGDAGRPSPRCGGSRSRRGRRLYRGARLAILGGRSGICRRERGGLGL